MKSTRRKNKGWLYFLVPFCVLFGVFFLLVIFNYQVRISLFLNFNKSGCANVSSDGKWVVCRAMTGEEGGYLDYYSTTFPFRKFTAYLPPISSNPDDDYYDNFKGNPVGLSSWSTTGSSLFVYAGSLNKNKKEDFCIIHIHSDGSNLVNCYKDPKIRQFGHFEWSINSENAIYTILQSNGSFEITIFDQNAKIINQFTTPSLVFPRNGEVLGENYFTWDGTTIYLWLGYRYPEQPSGLIPHVKRITVNRFTVDNPQNVKKLVDEEGNFSLISIDPKGRYLLFIDENDILRETKFQLVDIVNGGPFTEISINPMKVSEIWSNSYYCLNNCNKTAIEMVVNNDEPVLVWSWNEMNYKYYPKNQFVIGRTNNLNGFLCLPGQWFFGTNFFWVNVCK